MYSTSCYRTLLIFNCKVNIHWGNSKHEGGWGQWVVKMEMVAVADTLCLWAEPHSGHCSVISPVRSVSKPHQGQVKTALFLRPQRLRSHSLGKIWPQTYLPVLFRPGRVISRVMVWWSGHGDLRKVAESHRKQNSHICEKQSNKWLGK